MENDKTFVRTLRGAFVFVFVAVAFATAAVVVSGCNLPPMRYGLTCSVDGVTVYKSGALSTRPEITQGGVWLLARDTFYTPPPNAVCWRSEWREPRP